MSKEDVKEITQDVENTETVETEVVEEVSATPTATEETSETVVEEIIETEVKSEDKTLELVNYLDNYILDVRVVTEAELAQYDQDDEVEESGDFEAYFSTFAEVRERDVTNGTVVGLSDREVLVDIGFKAEGMIDRGEFSELPEIGDVIEVFVVTFEDRRGNIILSKERADFQRRWNQIRKSFEDEEVINGTIVRRIKGGMIVDLGVVQAFLPGSQIDVKPVMDFDEFVGMESDFKIVKFNELRQNIVLSRKAILASDLMEKRQEVLAQMEVGMVLEGMVKNITDFGAFIDLGGIDGLLHITDITWGRINHPTEKLTVGETITVKVIDFDVEKVRVSLGLKQLSPEPWENVMGKYPVDEVIKGKVVNMMNYGAFIELEEGVEGLIHVSEMSWTRHIKHPSDMFKMGDDVEVKVLSVDLEDKKISLGIKQLQDNPWDTIEAKYGVGSVHKGIVRNLTQFGAFVQLEEGIDGLVHISDMSWTKVIKHPKEIVNKGQDVDVKILEVSSEERRLALGIKQLEEDPWEEISGQYTSGKKVEGTVIRVLEKGIIFDLGDNIEGIVPMKQIPKAVRSKVRAEYTADKTFEVMVQEVDGESKKIVLMLDLGDVEMEIPEKPKKQDSISTSDKLEIPQDVIDSISGASSSEGSEDE
ncbi:MAG: 30S ribosomal protein S1 [Candidatus Marinimicrobia bacterium]|nr:30S ribosomal protein S1 [Candidatus Neomarinimicrobiota bacterium]